MDQFRQIGEVLGRLQALMVLKHDISINLKQCCLLFDVYTLAFETISEEIRRNLRLEDKNTKWKALEFPLKELHQKFKEGENYIKYCLDLKDWWGKAISLYQNRDCVEFHIHNLLCCFPVVIEALETAAEISALDQDEMQKRKLVITRKYDTELNNPTSFHWLFGKQYLVPREINKRLDIAAREDKWLLIDTVEGRKNSEFGVMAKHEHRLGDFLISRLCGSDTLEVLPSWVLTGATDYHVKRRLGTAKSRIKEICWLGENFALRNYFGEIEPLNAEISLVLSLSHPNIMHYNCAFYDKEKKEGCLIMDLMQKNLEIYIKENYGQRKKVSLSIPVVVDIMLQIARGMEYLHSRKIYHGDLNPSNILLKASNPSSEGNVQAKVTGFGVTSIKSSTYRTKSGNQHGGDPVIWYAPEVLAEQEQPGNKNCSKYTEKADIYSFAMLCFELLTGKVPFEDNDYLQEDKMVRNILLGIRPLFPHPSPKYIVNLLRKCWQVQPSNRPSFSSICRILRYIKKVLVINPDHGQPDAPPPLVDYCDIETGYLNKFPEAGNSYLDSVSLIPFQMFAYKLVEKEKTSSSLKEKGWDLANEAFLTGTTGSILEDVDDDIFLQENDQRSVQSEVLQRENSALSVADPRSVCSESPRRKHLSLAYVDCSPVHPENPENKVLPTTHEPGSTCLITQEKTAQPTITVDKFFSPENTGKKNKQSTPIPDKKVARITRTTQRTRHLPRFKISEKKVLSPKKLIDTKSSTSLSNFKRRSPRTSPKRPLNGISLPWSSTARVPKETETRTPKVYSTTSPSPRSPPARVLKETTIRTPREDSASLPARGKSKCRSQSSPTQTLPSPRSSPAKIFTDMPTKALKESPPPPRVPKNLSPTLASPEQAHQTNFIINETKYSSS
ncbi:Serinethreonine-protein kinase ht1 [Heracleum sosnowskyi]|uniref:Serinethreonine-protein kinase ht1 n=1 Tax=Heracleum sosnowskyi TaxID=360622 RepID=A0AAD8I1B1_9APIA|nr:Serinethreonine-protein kinase ht1 [Heracleum sosnowskyi]